MNSIRRQLAAKLSIGITMVAAFIFVAVSCSSIRATSSRRSQSNMLSECCIPPLNA